ncbi:RAMP superfamily CRISPR-associated protein [Actinomadura livida]|nr:RAMP superfamily CRISPR-associated protein [Actinomadura livida]GGU02886.1 hypothetical protein GCM10010208_28770 [Actinomadura livida]
MSNPLRVTITFHGPFRVATGVPREGLDVPVDKAGLLPASSLKGVQRAAARQLLPARADLVDEVFGGGMGTSLHSPSPWHWTDAELDGTERIMPRARVAIDAATGTARNDHLMFGEEVWARTAVFEITQRAPLDGVTRRRHHVVLACSAAAVHALGADRRRGHGWVTLTPADPAVDATVLADLEALRD